MAAIPIWLIVIVSVCLYSANALSGTVSAEASGKTLTINCGSKDIDITSATYGGNCGVAANNQLNNLRNACNGKSSCSYKVDHTKIGDPAVGCGKTYTYQYNCASISGSLSAEASGKTLTINCGKEDIKITSATYGGNCGAASNNQLSNLQSACDGKSICSYKVNHGVIGDPAVGCGKTYDYKYNCVAKRGLLSPEASGKTLTMNCGNEDIQVTSATYGGNCGASNDNQLSNLRNACDGKSICSYRVNHGVIGDPVPGCGKTYDYEYVCVSKSGSLSAEASGKILTINCGNEDIRITSATYGGNCGVPSDNQLSNLGNACDGKNQCVYKVDHTKIGDPAVGCGKTYNYEYSCVSKSGSLNPEASGKTLTINCGNEDIRIASATYGGNCGAPIGNQLNNLQNACNGKSSCSYKVDHTKIGDPVPGCGKKYDYEYSCVPKASEESGSLSAEASGKTLSIDCKGEIIEIVSASYGSNCNAPINNQLSNLQNACDGKSVCNYKVDHRVIGDAAVGCGKTYDYKYNCNARTGSLTPEASGKTLTIDCGNKAIDIKSATYGRNCGVSVDNQLSNLQNACDGKSLCNYRVNHLLIGDPAPGCGKTYDYEYICVPKPSEYKGSLSAEASGKTLNINCINEIIEIISATYGRNCGAPADNQLSNLQTACDGKSVCDYKVDHTKIGDPAVGCGKIYDYKYNCNPNRGSLTAEASGKTLTINCGNRNIDITSATYGGNCGASMDNQLTNLENACNDKNVCNYRVNHRIIGDPAVGCGKTYDYEYICIQSNIETGSLTPEASGKTLTIDCGSSQIDIISASYGLNCGASFNNQFGNLQNACDGKNQCVYKVDHRIIGDPAVGCGKTYDYKYVCKQVQTPPPPPVQQCEPCRKIKQVKREIDARLDALEKQSDQPSIPSIDNYYNENYNGYYKDLFMSALILINVLLIGYISCSMTMNNKYKSYQKIKKYISETENENAAINI